MKYSKLIFAMSFLLMPNSISAMINTEEENNGQISINKISASKPIPTSEEKDEVEEIVKKLENNPELLNKVLNKIKDKSSEPQSIRKNSKIVQGIKDVSKGAKKISEASYYTAIVTNFVAPMLKFFKYENAALIAQEINSYGKTTGGLCKVTSGLCDSITEEQPLFLLNSMAGATEILGAHMQKSAIECSKEIEVEEKKLLEAKNNISKIDNIECKDTINVKSLVNDFEQTKIQSEKKIVALTEDKLKYQCGSIVFELSNKIAEKSFNDLNKSQNIKQDLPKVIGSNVVNSVIEEVVTNPSGSLYVGAEVKEALCKMFGADKKKEDTNSN